ncbi:hypothetical protein [Streptomyces sp. ODS28]|uniref:hypothetical protein n=1 Tax=Streptomyces sp. ODS28 TaxID=3136688 RepID=UPI0031EB4565
MEGYGAGSGAGSGAASPELAEHFGAMREGRGDPAAMLGEFRRTAVLVPLEEGRPLAGEYGGVRWIHTFTDEQQLGLFLRAQGRVASGASGASGEYEYAAVLGARLLDVLIPEQGVPTGIAVDAADEEHGMLLPPVRGIVPDEVALELDEEAPGEGAPVEGVAP